MSFAVPVSSVGFRPAKLIIDEDADVDQILKEMEERREIPPVGSLPAGWIRAIVHRIVKWPKHDK
jgi:hypothetical protein